MRALSFSGKWIGIVCELLIMLELTFRLVSVSRQRRLKARPSHASLSLPLFFFLLPVSQPNPNFHITYLSPLFQSLLLPSNNLPPQPLPLPKRNHLPTLVSKPIPLHHIPPILLPNPPHLHPLQPLRLKPIELPPVQTRKPSELVERTERFEEVSEEGEEDGRGVDPCGATVARGTGCFGEGGVGG